MVEVRDFKKRAKEGECQMFFLLSLARHSLDVLIQSTLYKQGTSVYLHILEPNNLTGHNISLLTTSLPAKHTLF